MNSEERRTRQGAFPYYGAQGVIDHVDGYLFDGRYILVAEDGENLNSRKLPLALIAQGRFWVNNHAHIIRSKPGRADDVFLLHALNCTDIRPFVTGAAQPKLSQANLKRIGLRLPPIGEQRRIASILSAYDDLIENCRRRIRILEDMARGLYREWFVHFRFPGADSLPRVDSALGPIPQGWESRGIKQIANVIYGFPFQSDAFNAVGRGVPVVRIRDIPSGASGTFTDESADAKYEIVDGDVLVGMDGDFHMCIWAAGHAMQNQRVAKFRSAGEIGTFRLLLSLEAPIQALNKAIVGTTVAHLGDMHIKKIEFAWPPASLRAQLDGLLEPMAREVIGLKKKVANLRCTRDLLLPRLMSGQIDLRAAEDARPA